MVPTPTPFPISQPDLAKSLGISADELKKIRDELLDPDTDWKPGRPVLFNETGVEKIRAALQLPATQKTPPDGADASTGSTQRTVEKNAGGGRVALTVVRVARGTKLIVWCREKTGAPEVRLRVKDNANFCPGMIVPRCVRHHAQDDLFLMEGRLPRFKGRF